MITIYFALQLPYQFAVRDINYIDHSRFNASFYWFSCIFYIFDLIYNMGVQRFDQDGNLTKCLKYSITAYLKKEFIFDLVSNLIFFQVLTFGEIFNDQAKNSIIHFIKTGKSDGNKFFIIHQWSRYLFYLKFRSLSRIIRILDIIWDKILDILN